MPSSSSGSFIKEYVVEVDALNKNIVKNLKDYNDNYTDFNVNNFGHRVNTRNLGSTTYEQTNQNKNPLFSYF